MTSSIHKIKDSDIEGVLNIYKPYIKNTAITFEEQVPEFEDFKERVLNITSFYPWLVYQDNGIIKGYAYACAHRQREAYKWSVDVAIYLSADAHGKGIGTSLYNKLFELLKKQGFYNAYAGIALPNEKSVTLHEKFGFRKIAEYHNVGYKMNKWWNVGWWELELQVKHRTPAPLESIHTIDL